MGLPLACRSCTCQEACCAVLACLEVGFAGILVALAHPATAAVAALLGLARKRHRRRQEAALVAEGVAEVEARDGGHWALKSGGHGRGGGGGGGGGGDGGGVAGEGIVERVRGGDDDGGGAEGDADVDVDDAVAVNAGELDEAHGFQWERGGGGDGGVGMEN